MIDSTLLWSLFSAGFLSATLLPGGSEAALLWAVNNTSTPETALWLATTLGNSLGGISGWLLGFWLASRFPYKKDIKPEYQKAISRLRQHGSPLLLLSWIPIIGDPLCVAAGWLKIGWLPAVVYITVGKAVRYGMLLMII